MSKVLLIAGTRPPGGTPNPADWWHPGSAFADALRHAGHVLAADQFTWTQDVEGLPGNNREWEEAGKSLCWYLDSHPTDAIIAYSDGGNVVAHALAGGPRCSGW